MVNELDSTEQEEIKSESRFQVLKTKLGLKAATAAAGLSGLAVLTAPVSAAEINWSEITGLLDGVTTIFPSMGNMVIAIVPVVLILVVVLFVVSFFDSIVGMIQGLANMFR